MESKGTVYKGEMFAASATTKVSVEKTHTRLLLPQERRHKRRGKEVHQEEVVFRWGNIKKRAEKTLKEIVRIRCVIIDILPYVNITKQNWDANSATSVCSEVDSQTSKKPKKSGGKGSVVLSKESKHLGCVFQDTEPPKSKSIYGRAQNLWDQIAPSDFRKAPYTTSKIGNEGSIAKGLFRNVNLKSATLVRPKSRIEHRKKPYNKNDAPAEKHGIWRKKFAMSRKQGHVLLSFRSLVIISTIFEETWGRIRGTFESINAHAEQKI